MSWLRAELHAPSLEHLSFRLGNQQFFVRILPEDMDTVPGTLHGLLTIASACRGHACLMPMEKRRGNWETSVSGWGLVAANTSKLIDPILFVNLLHGPSSLLSIASSDFVYRAGSQRSRVKLKSIANAVISKLDSTRRFELL
jgi:hypothetical protein